MIKRKKKVTYNTVKISNNCHNWLRLRYKFSQKESLNIYCRYVSKSLGFFFNYLLLNSKKYKKKYIHIFKAFFTHIKSRNYNNNIPIVKFTKNHVFVRYFSKFTVGTVYSTYCILIKFSRN